MGGKYMNTVLIISDGESQLRKVKRKTSLSLSLYGHRGESRTQKTTKKYKTFSKNTIFHPKNDNHPILKMIAD
jgi:hypothetical protein